MEHEPSGKPYAESEIKTRVSLASLKKELEESKGASERQILKLQEDLDDQKQALQKLSRRDLFWKTTTLLGACGSFLGAASFIYKDYQHSQLIKEEQIGNALALGLSLGEWPCFELQEKLNPFFLRAFGEPFKEALNLAKDRKELSYTSNVALAYAEFGKLGLKVDLKALWKQRLAAGDIPSATMTFIKVCTNILRPYDSDYIKNLLWAYIVAVAVVVFSLLELELTVLQSSKFPKHPDNSPNCTLLMETLRRIADGMDDSIIPNGCPVSKNLRVVITEAIVSYKIPGDKGITLAMAKRAKQLSNSSYEELNTKASIIQRLHEGQT